MKHKTLKHSGNKQWKYLIMSVCSIVTFLLVWEVCTDVLHLTTPTTLPSPVRVFSTFIDKFTNTKPDGATLQVHTLESMKVALSGLPQQEAGAGTGTYGLFRDLAAPFGVAVFVWIVSVETAKALQTQR